jgi:predicted Na+-dependent transporter
MSSPVPGLGPALPPLAVVAVFTVMFALGLGLLPRALWSIRSRAGLVARGLFSVVIAVPVMALIVVQVFDLPRFAEIGLVLMSISPGAPVALKRSLDAGGDRAFAPALQLVVALFAVVSLPTSIAVLNRFYEGQAWIHPAAVARQVFVAQLLPLTLGMGVRSLFPERAIWLEPRLGKFGMGLLLTVALLIVIAVAPAVLGAGPRLALASAMVTVLALAAGHLLGGPEPATRMAVAISSAARNPGLALLVVTLNPVPPAVSAAVMTYFLASALTIVPYLSWQRPRQV